MNLFLQSDIKFFQKSQLETTKNGDSKVNNSQSSKPTNDKQGYCDSSSPILHNESFLIQCILHEFLNTMSTIQLFSTICLKSAFLALVGHDSIEYISLSKINLKQHFFRHKSLGTLGKLHCYLYHLFSLSSSENEASILEKQMLDTAQKALKIATACYHHLTALSLSVPTSTLLEKEQKKLTTHIQRLQKLLLKKLVFYRNEERVLFFLFKRHTDFDNLHKKPIVAPLLKMMFSNGLEEAAEFISNKYKTRGFDHLVPFIHDKLLSLKQSCL